MRALDYVTEEIQEQPGLLDRIRGDEKPSPRYLTSYVRFVGPTITEIKQVLESGENPGKEFATLWRRAKAVSNKDWGMIGKPYKPQDRQARAEAQEVVRLWFTKMLRLEVGKPITINISKDERYRL